MDNVLRKHQDSFFWIFTNGTLFGNIFGLKIQNLKNVFFFFSLEGSESETDFRRGKGVYEKILKSMERARSLEIPFGFSCTVADYNVRSIDKDDFIDEMIDNGCKGGIYIDYKDYFEGKEGIRECLLEEKTEFEKNILAKNFEKDIWFLYIDSIERELGGCQGGKRFIHLDPQLGIANCPLQTDIKGFFAKNRFSRLFSE
ncbi:MAG: hypothetical protein D6734_05630 [Candidatus Schekmanbacteria bacterium]|nr:MAG: hypothetical protein D6734_05630 [Candidatus Schekmanbacteria bacterium]